MTEDKVIIDDEDFNFDNAQGAGAKKDQKTDTPPEDEATALARLKGKLGGKAREIKKLKKQVGDQGKVTAKVIAEARKLAESKKGLDIDTFFTKHKLVGVDVEQLLSAPLNKDGTYA